MNLSFLEMSNNLLEPSPAVQLLCAVQTTTLPVQLSTVPACLLPERIPQCFPQRHSKQLQSTLILYVEDLECCTLSYQEAARRNSKQSLIIRPNNLKRNINFETSCTTGVFFWVRETRYKQKNDAEKDPST